MYKYEEVTVDSSSDSFTVAGNCNADENVVTADNENVMNCCKALNKLSNSIDNVINPNDDNDDDDDPNDLFNVNSLILILLSNILVLLHVKSNQFILKWYAFYHFNMQATIISDLNL